MSAIMLTCTIMRQSQTQKRYFLQKSVFKDFEENFILRFR